MPKLTNPPTDLSHAIRDARLNRRMTQFDLAVVCKVSQPLVSSWERGRSRPHPEAMRILHDHLGIPYDLYFTTDTVRYRQPALDLRLRVPRPPVPHANSPPG